MRVINIIVSVVTIIVVAGCVTTGVRSLQWDGVRKKNGIGGKRKKGKKKEEIVNQGLQEVLQLEMYDKVHEDTNHSIPLNAVRNVYNCFIKYLNIKYQTNTDIFISIVVFKTSD